MNKCIMLNNTIAAAATIRKTVLNLPSLTLEHPQQHASAIHLEMVSLNQSLEPTRWLKIRCAIWIAEKTMLPDCKSMT